MIRFPFRSAARLDAADRRLHGRLTAGGRSKCDDGFVLLETIVSLGLITVIAAALTTFLTTTTQVTSHLRIRQEAIQLADTAVENVHGYAPGSLKTGRDATSATQQAAAAGTAPASLSTLLQTITPVSDPAAAVNQGSTPCSTTTTGCAYLPTTPVSQTIGTRIFQTSYYLGNCYIPSAGTDCGKTIPTGTAYRTFLRAVIAVTWSNDHCSASSCLYVTNALVNADPDPKFNFNQPAPSAPVITLIASRTNKVLDTVAVPTPTLDSGTGIVQGVAPFTWSATNLPPGLNMAPDGTISGQVTTVGVYSVTVTVIDGLIHTASPVFSWSVLAPITVCIPSIALPNGGFEAAPAGLTGPSYPNNPHVGDAGLLWGTTEPDHEIELWGNGAASNSANGGLPIVAEEGTQWAELNANQTGALFQDLPTIAGQVLQWSVWHRARYSGNSNGLDVMQVQIGSTTSQSPQVPTGQTTAMISDGPGAWVRYTGVYTVPAGQSTTRFQFAAISTASGSNSIGNFIDNLSLNNNVACLTSAVVDQTSTVNTPIAPVQVSVDRGTGPFVWGGGASLPAGLTMTSAGVITGTPTALGISPVVLTLTDATLFGQTVSFNWTVVPKPTITAPANQTSLVGAIVAVPLTPTCPNSPCSYALNNGPSGLVVSAGGVISGTITAPAGTFTVSVTVTDAAGATATTANFNWTVKAAPTITTPSTQTSTIGAAVSLQVNSTCPNTPCTFTLANPPAGLSINPGSGLITGTISTSAVTSTTVTVTIKDASNVTATTANFTWNVTNPPLVATTPATQNSTRGTAITPLQMSATGGSGTYAWSGTVPAGLTLSGTGLITGAPTAAGTTSVTLTVTSGTTANVTFTWNVTNPPLVPTNPGAQTSTINTTITPVQLTASGGSGTYVWSGSSTLPAGLAMTAAGRITGTPTAISNTSVNLTVTDATAGLTRNFTFTWTVTAKPTVTTPATQTTTIGAAFGVAVTATCPNAPCRYTLAGAPAGLTIDGSSGIVSGPPTATGTSSAVKVTLTDNAGAIATTNGFTWIVDAAPTMPNLGNQTVTVGQAFNVALMSLISCPNSPCTYRVNNGPDTLSIDSGGNLSGTITSGPQLFSRVTLSATDNAGVTGTSTAFAVTVVAPSPVGHWTFDETSGTTAADTSGNGHTATLSGGYGKTATAIQGARALTTNGAAAATTSGTVISTSNSFTVSAWVNLTNLTGYQTVVSQDGTNVSGFYLGLRGDTGKFGFARYSSDSTSGLAVASSVNAPVAGQWYQLAGVYDASAHALSLYVNGVKQGNAVSYPTGWNATGPLVIGRGKSGGANTNWVNGAIDDVRVYSAALTSDSVAQIAEAGYWNLDEGTGTTANDGSLNSFDGTLAGGTTWTPGVVGPSAVDFDGTTGVINTGAAVIDTSQSYSVSAWARADVSDGSSDTVASIDGTNVSGFRLQQRAGKWAMVAVASDSSGSPTITTVQSTANVVVGQWYQLVAVYDSVAKTLTLYVNGVKQGSSVPYATAWEATGQFVIGRGKSGGVSNDFFNGAIDDVHAYPFTLDQAAATALAASAPPTPAAPTGTPGVDAATVSWVAPADINGSPVTGYVVTPYLNGVAQTARTYSSAATTQTLTGLNTGVSYTFTVASVNANATSDASAQSAAVVPL